MSTRASPTVAELSCLPLTGALGAEVPEVDLGSELSDAMVEAVMSAMASFGVLVFRDQSLTREQHLEFARRCGELEVHPIVNGMPEYPEIIKMHKPAGDDASFGVGWHSDNSFFEIPSLGSIVYGEVVPPYGGDTLFSSQMLAYEQLSEGMKELLDGLHAVHTAEDAYTSPTALEKYEGKGPITYRRTEAVHSIAEHPVVRTHPLTDRKALYVNEMFAQRFVGMTDEESQPLLKYLFRHSVREDFQCRIRWQPGTLVMWDNRCVQHAALNDYKGYERILYRITLKGERPR